MTTLALLTAGCRGAAVGVLVLGVLIFAVGIYDRFVVAIFVSLLALFFSFALNMWLYFRRLGPWRDPVFTERAYILLILLAKSALAWQVFAGVLAGG